MENVNRKIYLVLAGAFIMALIAVSTYLAFSKPKIPEPTKLMPLKDFAIAATINGTACVNTNNGDVLWNCANSTCTSSEIESCLNNAKSYAQFMNNEITLTSQSSASAIDIQESVAGISDVSCSNQSSAITGQLGCLSSQKVSVVGPPKTFSGTVQDPKNKRAFSALASNKVYDSARFYDVTKNESVKLGIDLRNNSTNQINDKYTFLVQKVTQAPIGMFSSSNTALCSEQLVNLEEKNDIELKQHFVQSDIDYKIEPKKSVFIGGEWKPSTNDCGLYKVSISANTFKDEHAKACPANKPNSDVVAMAYVRVAGNCTFAQCDRIEIISDNEQALKANNLKAGDNIKVRMYLDKSPKEINLGSNIVAELNYPSSLNYVDFTKQPDINCVNSANKINCTLSNNSPVKFVELKFKVAENLLPNEEIKLGMNVLQNGSVVGGTCSKTLSTNQSVASCEYKPMGNWVEQSRKYNGKDDFYDSNSPAKLRTFTVPQSAQKQKVKVMYEYAPIGDKTIKANNGACAPQSNEEAEIYVVGENLINKTYYAGHRFSDNLFKDTLTHKITNPNPDLPTVIEQELELAPGSYSITSKWQGDGEDFWDKDISDKKYFVDVRNQTKGSVSYDDAITNSSTYGPLCNWAGSYRVRASYCIENESPNYAQQLERAVITIKNNALVGNLTSSVHVNGVRLVLPNAKSTLLVEAGKTKTFEFVYQNPFPDQSVIEIVQDATSGAEADLLAVGIIEVKSKQVLLDFREKTRLSQNPIKIKFPQ